MIKAIFFDFDGVILESAHIKTKAFGQLFARWPEKVDEIVRYHIRYAGVSRYVKFRHFYENIVKLPYSKAIEMDLGKQYSELVLDEVKKAPFVRGIEAFLEEYNQKLPLFVVSATPQAELNSIVKIRNLTKYFKKVRGFPPEKVILLKNVMNEFSLVGGNCVYIGDGQSDMEAAAQVNMPFILRVTPENAHLKSTLKHTIDDITTLKEVLTEIYGGSHV